MMKHPKCLAPGARSLSPIGRFTGVALTLLVAAALAFPALAQGRPDLRWIAGGHVGINSIAISPDRTMLVSASLSDATLKLWNTSNGTLIRTLAGDAAGLNAVAFSPDAQFVASAGDTALGSPDVNIKLWRVSDGTIVRTFGAPNSATAWSVGFSPDGTKLAVGHGSDVEIWRVADGVLLRTLTGHTGNVFSVKFAPDGVTVASGSADRTAKLWNSSTGALLRTLTGHTFFVFSVAFSPDGLNLATGSWDMTAKIWKVSNGQLLKTLTGHTDAINAIDYTPDGSVVVTGGADNTIKEWNPGTGALIRTLSDPGIVAIQSLQVASDGLTLFSGSSDSLSRQWLVSTGAIQRRFGSHTARVRAVAFSSDGHFASGSDDRTAKLWNAPDGTLLRQLIGHNDVVNAVDFTSDNQTVVTAAGSPRPDTVDPSVKLWNVSDGSLLRTLPGHPGGSFCAAFSPDSQFVATGGDDISSGLVRLWRVSDGAQIRTFSHTSAVQAVRFSPDGQTIVSGAGSIMTWWRVSDGTKLRSISTGGLISAISISADGLTIADAEQFYGTNVKVYSFSDGSLIRAFAGHTNFPTGVAISPDGATVLSGSGYDYDLRLWRVSDGAELVHYDQECGWGPNVALPVAISTDGGTFGYGRGDATVAVANHPSPPDAKVLVTKDPVHGNIHISWTGGVAPFTLRRAENPQFTIGVTTLVNQQNVTSFDDPVLSDGRTYYYLVD